MQSVRQKMLRYIFFNTCTVLLGLMRLYIPLMSMVVFILFLALPAAAHVPVLSGDHNTLAMAMQIKDPEITYAIYGTLHETGQADYYIVSFKKGNTLNFMVATPLQGSFAPWLMIAGPGLSPQGMVPPGIIIPTGDQAVVVAGARPLSADYEPFSPMSTYQTAMYTATAPTDRTYVIAVYTPDNGGPYSLATGTLETFTAPEWILVPLDMVGVRIWQGQPPLLIFGPFLGVLVIGAGLLFMRPGLKRMTLAVWLGFFAGLLYVGSGAATLIQTGIALQMASAGLAVLVTLVFAAIALCAGAAAITASVRSSEPIPWKFRVLMAGIGIIGLAAWAGLIIGPVFAFAAALIPDRNR